MIGDKLNNMMYEKHVKNKTKLAKELGISPQLMYKYENNLAMPSYENLKKIADYFNVDVEELIEDEKIDKNKLEDNLEIENLVKISNSIDKEIVLNLTRTNEKSLDHIIELGKTLIKLSEKIADITMK